MSAVPKSNATFEADEWTIEQRLLWFREFELHQGLYNLFVAKINEELVGFAYNAKYKEKPTYITSSEVMVYVKQGVEGHGIGQALYDGLFSAVSHSDLHRLYAIVAMPNDISIRLHQKFGFKEVGHLHEVGFKHGKFHSTVLLEKQLIKAR